MVFQYSSVFYCWFWYFIIRYLVLWSISVSSPYAKIQNIEIHSNCLIIFYYLPFVFFYAQPFHFSRKRIFLNKHEPGHTHGSQCNIVWMLWLLFSFWFVFILFEIRYTDILFGIITYLLYLLYRLTNAQDFEINSSNSV